MYVSTRESDLEPDVFLQFALRFVWLPERGFELWFVLEFGDAKEELRVREEKRNLY